MLSLDKNSDLRPDIALIDVIYLLSFESRPLDSFSAFENYTPELKECLEKTAKLCEETKTDKSTENFKAVTARHFDKVKHSKEFKAFYCENFEKGKVSFNSDRKCNLEILNQELEKHHSCEFIPKNDDDASEALNICGQFLIDELKKPEYLTPALKNNFKKTLVDVIDGFKKLYPKNKDVAQALSKISLDTDFEYRLSTFVAGREIRVNFKVVAHLGEKLPIGAREIISFFLVEESFLSHKTLN